MIVLKKHAIDFPGVIIGIVIGLIFGFLINSRMREPIIPSNTSNKSSNLIYLLQVYKTASPEQVISYSDQLKSKGLDPVYVHEGSFYYLYLGIAKEEDDLASDKAVLDQFQIPYVVKSQALNNYPNNIIGEPNYQFWVDGVNNFLLALANKSFTINEEYLNNPAHAEFHKNLIYLNALVQKGSPQVKKHLLLETYKLIVENLS